MEARHGSTDQAARWWGTAFHGDAHERSLLGKGILHPVLGYSDSCKGIATQMHKQMDTTDCENVPSHERNQQCSWVLLGHVLNRSLCSVTSVSY